MEFNLNTNNQEEDPLVKQKQKIESMRFDLLKSELELTKAIAAKEVDNLKRKCHNLEELASRLQQDIKISREREMKDQEKINNLLTKLEMNDKEYTEKLVELKMKVFDIECVTETIRNLHCQKKSSFTEAGDLPLPSKIGINNSTREASTVQKGGIASSVKERIFRTLDSRTISTADENNITAHSATITSSSLGNGGEEEELRQMKNTVQKEGPKDSTDLSKHDLRPKGSAGHKRTAILEEKKISQTLDSRSTSKTTNGQNFTAHSVENTFQEEDPKDLSNPSKTSLRPMKRSKTSDTLKTRNPIITSTNKASAGQKRTAILEKKKLSQTLDSRSTPTTNGQNITAHGTVRCDVKTTVQEEDPKDLTNPNKNSSRPMKGSKTSDSLRTRNPIITSCDKASAGQKRRTAILERKKISQALDSRNTPTTTNGQNIIAHSTITTVQVEDPKDLINPIKTSTRPMKRPKTSNTSRTRNPVITSCNKVSNQSSDFVQVSTRKGRTFCRSGDTKDSGKECKGQLATSEQIACALKKAEMLQSNLKSHNPSFIKSMSLSHVSHGFFLHIPSKFRKENLHTVDRELDMILEDESGLGYRSKYLSSGVMHGLSGGWGGFALAHNLEIGDALIFELTNPSRFKVHIIKAIQQQSSIEGGK